MWWLILIGAAIVSLLAAGYPMFVIQPFKHQDASALSLALQVRQWAPLLSLIAALVAVFALLRIWAAQRWPAKSGAVLLAFLAAGGAAFSRINVFERMFAPVDQLSYWSASEAKLDLDDMVMSVRFQSEARAYPIRMLAYHHVVNDWLGGVPLVGTY
jgi:hypothetical protein